MDLQKLKELYQDDQTAIAFFDHMARRVRNQTETNVDRILSLLEQDGVNLSRGEVVGLFRTLEELGCGVFRTGRRGSKSRFVWSVGSLSASRVVAGEQEEVENVQNLEDSAEEDFVELITHEFNLRPELTIEIELPIDLTDREGERLSLFMKSLPLGEYE